MTILKHLVFALLASMLCPSLANAQNFRVIVLNETGGVLSTQDFASGADVTVNLGAIAALRTVRIFSINTLGTPSAVGPNAGAGKIVLLGSAVSTARVNLFIADGDDTTFPPNGDPQAAAFLNPGLTTLGGSLTGVTLSDGQLAHDYDLQPWSSVNTNGSTSVYDTDPVTPGFQVNTDLRGIIIPDPSLRRQTVLAAVVSQDVCPGFDPLVGGIGRIEVGQVLRLSANGTLQSEGSVLHGNLNAHVLAVGRDQHLTYADINSPPMPVLPGQTIASTTTGFRAVETLSAGNAIRGSVSAFGRAYDDSGNLNPREEDPEPTQFVERFKWLEKKWINRGSIFNVRVGPSLSASGLYGSIVSRFGRIYSVRSTGEIVGGEIKAADGVLEVRIHNWGNQTSANPNNAVAAQAAIKKNLAVPNIDAGDLFSVQFIGNRPEDDYEATIQRARTQGAIHLIETKGAFNGNVRCINLIDAGENGPRDSRGRAGIIVWDWESRHVHEPSSINVSVDQLVHNACVLSPTIGELIVGWQFKGTAVAFGSPRKPQGESAGPTMNRVPGDVDKVFRGGTINNLDIGKHATNHDSMETTRYVYVGMIPGMVGGFRPPVSLDPADPQNVDDTVVPILSDPRINVAVNVEGVETPGGAPGSVVLHEHPMHWDHDRWLFVRPLEGPTLPEDYLGDGGALDSVIRAEIALGAKGELHGMHQRVFEREGHKTVVSWYRPRLESPVINMLFIPGGEETPPGTFDDTAGIFEGVVWSGAAEYLPIAPYGMWLWQNSVYDWHAVIGRNSRVMRVGPGGDIWGNNLSLNVLRDMCGELHATSLEPGSDISASSWGIRIGHRLGTLGSWPDVGIAHWPFPSYANAAQDPARGPRNPTPFDQAALSPPGQIGQQFEADIAPLGAVYAGLHGSFWLENGPGFILTARQIRLETNLGVIVNAAYRKNLDGVVETVWDGPGNPLADPASAWQGFVRVGSLWQAAEDPAYLVYTLAPQGTVGVSPPVTVDDHAVEYKRHRWELHGETDAFDFREGGSIGVLPFALHEVDSAPTQLNAALPGVATSYVGLPIDIWKARWPLYEVVIGAPQDQYGQPGLRAARASFYGPVRDDPALGVSHVDLPVTVWEYRPDEPGGPWHKLSLVDSSGDRGDNFFDYIIYGANLCDMYIGPRCNMPIRPGFFKFTLHDQVTDAAENRFPNNRLLCADFQWSVFTEPPAPFEWYLNLVRGNEVWRCADVGMQGGVDGSDGLYDNNDFIVFINWHFNEDPRADMGTTGGVFGQDGLWNNNDYIVFIDLFFEQTCELPVFSCTSGFSAGGQAGGVPGEQSGRSSDPADNTTVGENAVSDRFAPMRAALQHLIAIEPPGPRRDQLIEMLNAIPAHNGQPQSR